MPNHIANELKLVGPKDRIEKALEFLRGKEDFGMDFNAITPMPPWIYGSSPGVSGIGADDYAKWGRENTSLEWARTHWGTKWNAYGESAERNTADTLYFNTAWNGVPDLMQKIAWIFPDLQVHYRFADEDYGSANHGIWIFQDNDVLHSSSFGSGSKEAYELSFDLHADGQIPDWLRFDKQTWTYVVKEEEEEN